VARDIDGDGQMDVYEGGDPCVGKFMELRVHEYTGTDLSMNPANFIAGRQKMIPLNRPTAAELASARHRVFEFGRSGGTDEAHRALRRADRRVGRSPTGADAQVRGLLPHHRHVDLG
jgi:hypothetical protein